MFYTAAQDLSDPIRHVLRQHRLWLLSLPLSPAAVLHLTIDEYLESERGECHLQELIKQGCQTDYKKLTVIFHNNTVVTLCKLFRLVSKETMSVIQRQDLIARKNREIFFRDLLRPIMENNSFIRKNFRHSKIKGRLDRQGEVESKQESNGGRGRFIFVISRNANIKYIGRRRPRTNGSHQSNSWTQIYINNDSRKIQWTHKKD